MQNNIQMFETEEFGKNRFKVERYLSTKLKLKVSDVFEVMEVDVSNAPQVQQAP